MKLFQLLAIVMVVMLVSAAPAMAQSTAPSSVFFSGTGVGVGLGAALAVIGAGYGFGKIGAAALEGMARQPEVAGQIQTAMIIIAALLEGATFFALVILIILQGRAGF